ncbi:zinc metalloprotease, partial [Staphylococcus aureus]
ETLLTEETLVAEQIQSLFYEGKLPEIDYDAAKVVKDEDSEFNDGKFGKSYEEIRKEQLEDGQRDESEDRKEEKDIAEDKKEADKSDEKDEPAHRQAPNIEKPYDPNHPDNK